MSACLKCGGTGFLLSGELCDCGVKTIYYVPEVLEVPMQYQGVRFNSRLLPPNVQGGYADYMDAMYRTLTSNSIQGRKNVLICAPPNTGKTVFAYSVLIDQYMKGVSVVPLMDIMEVRAIMMNPYDIDVEKVESISKSQVMFIKIPMDLPSRLAESMSTIIERRVRNSASTIFLYSGTYKDLIAQDTFGKLRMLIGDGSYNSIEVKSFYYEVKEENKKE